MMKSYIFIIKSQNLRVVVIITATYNSYICTAISKYILEQFVVYDLLEPDASQGASPVLRGRDYSDIVLLPDHSDANWDFTTRFDRHQRPRRARQRRKTHPNTARPRHWRSLRAVPSFQSVPLRLPVLVLQECRR